MSRDRLNVVHTDDEYGEDGPFPAEISVHHKDQNCWYIIRKKEFIEEWAKSGCNNPPKLADEN